jgi:CheY-like chemotaxis protein
VDLLPATRQPAPPALPLQLPAGTRVLCYDDNPVALRWLTVFFERSGMAVVPVATPAAVLAALRDPNAPGLAVLDLDPAGDTGLLLEALATAAVPVLGLLPSGTPPAPPAPQLVSLAKPLRTLPFLRALQSLFQSKPGAAVPAPAAPARLLAEEIPLAVLLVEDNLVNQKVGVRFLERLGYRVDVAANGREALAAFSVRHYNFVLMDIQMPEMDGFETTREIRRQQDPKRAPRIVALTANAMQSDRDQSNLVGMDGFITKPVKLQEIADTIRRLFAPVAPGSPPA